MIIASARWITYVTMALMLHLSHAAPSAGLVVHSVKTTENFANKIPSTKDKAQISIDYSYDGSLGVMYVSAIAVSGDDWEISSPITMSASMAPGVHRVLSVDVDRPSETKEITRTNRVVILASPHGVYPTYRKITELPIEWPQNDYSRIVAFYPSMIVVSALGASDYDDIDRILSYWIDEDRYDKHGDWKVDWFYGTFSTYFNLDRSGTLERIQRWRVARPKSRAAALAEASYWVNYAADIRGYIGPGKAPDQDVLRVIRQYHANASKILDQSRAFSGNNPLWYWLRLKMAIDGNLSDQVINKTFDIGVQAFPKYQGLYMSMASYIVLNGGKQRWSRLNEVADRLDKATHVSNPGSYAELVATAGEVAGNYVPDLYTAGIVSWPKVKDSWKALIDRYPTPYNMNRFAAQACQANDKDTLQTLLGMIGNKIVPEVWPSNYSVDMCKRRIVLRS